MVSIRFTPLEIAATLLPLIAGPQLDGNTASVDTSMLTGVQSLQWSVVGGFDLGTDATQDLTGLGGSRVRVTAVHDGGVTSSPAMLVHQVMMHAGHNAMDAALLALAPHNTADNIAIRSGDWSDPETWAALSVPASGETALVPHGVEVIYDVDAPTTLIRQLRVDGTLRFATDIPTHLYVRDFIGEQMSRIAIGNSLGDRIADNVNAVVTFEGQTPLDLATDPQLLSRGLVTIGAIDIFGKEMLDHSRAAFGEASGSTSIVLEETPVGWGVGSEMIIGATSINMPFGLGLGIQDVSQDEIVTITGITGNTVSFSPALMHDHNNQNPRATRTDIRPMVQLRAQSRNVILKSETIAPASQRGHFMVMHHHSRTDLWDFGDIGMGRTDASIPKGVIDTDGTFKFHDRGGIVNGSIQNEPLTATSNIIGRYSAHFHRVGYDHEGAGRPRPTVVNLTVEGNLGWGVTHHDAEMDLFSSSVFKCYGSGFVAEQGGELGVWDNLSVMGSTAINLSSDVDLIGSPKGHHGDAGLSGDYGNDGYGFFYRGRSLTVTRCIATTCSHGHVWWHRDKAAAANGSNMLFESTNPPRSRMDLKETGIFNSDTTTITEGNWNFIDYPIVHFRDCGAIACLSGIFVSKQAPQQQHDFNVLWKGFFSHGHRYIGVRIEYIGTYILQDIDSVGGAEGLGNGYGQQGIRVGNNAYQVAFIRPRTEGNFNNGIYLSGSSLNGEGGAVVWADKDDFDAATDPRFFLIGHESIGESLPVNYVLGGSKTVEQIALFEDDFGGDYIDYDLNPSETFPLIAGTFNGTNSGAISSRVDNTDGLKFGNHPVGLPIANKTWQDTPFPTGALQIFNLARTLGYSQHQGSDVLVQREIISDVLTGRPTKITKLWQADNPITINSVDNGPITVSAPVTTTDEFLTVAPNGSVTFSLLTGAAGGSGSFEVDDGDYVAPDYGTLDIDYTTGIATYTPHRGLSGKTDFGYVFIRSVRDTGATQTETETYGTKRLSFLITADATLSAPVAATHYSITAPNAGEFEVSLLERPTAGGRFIKGVQYTTDAGTTWRRLCNGYPLSPIGVDVASDGSALTTGALDVGLRIATDHENGVSPTTAATSVLIG